MGVSSGTPDPTWVPPRFPDDAAARRGLESWLQHPTEPAILVDTDLRGADLSGGHFVESWFTDSDMRAVRLARADLYRSNMVRARLDEADLTSAGLVRVVLDEASLRGAVLRAANLTRASLTDTDARGADLTSCVLVASTLLQTDVRGAVLDHTGVDNASLHLLVDASTSVTGMHGSMHCSVTVDADGDARTLTEDECENWLRLRGADVRLLPRRVLVEE